MGLDRHLCLFRNTAMAGPQMKLIMKAFEKRAFSHYANSLDIRLWDGDGNFVDVLQWGTPWWHVVSYVHPDTKELHMINVWGPNRAERARTIGKKVLGR